MMEEGVNKIFFRLKLPVEEEMREKPRVKPAGRVKEHASITPSLLAEISDVANGVGNVAGREKVMFLSVRDTSDSRRPTCVVVLVPLTVTVRVESPTINAGPFVMREASANAVSPTILISLSPVPFSTREMALVSDIQGKNTNPH